MIYKWYILSIIFLLIMTACRTDSTEIPEGESYTELHRPQFHFSPESGWMNDPNGMVYFDGEYHLFYQYYPNGTKWDTMHWGHTVSEDLIHWKHLPIGLYPDDLGYIFSGSAVVDWNNTSGFGINDEPPLIAIFTHHLMSGEKAGRNDFQVQSIAYSTDKGRQWTKYDQNPVIGNPGIRDFRDPKVIWSDEYNIWVMVFAARDRILFYESPNLKNWTKTGEFGLDEGARGMPWECPDLFPIKVDDSGEEKWILIVSIGNGGPNGGSGTQYFIGDFNGKTFVNDNDAQTILWLDYGKDNYAGVTWSDIPAEDGRRLFIGWMSNWQYAQDVPTVKWRSAMTIPRKLHLRETEAGLRLVSQPVEELQDLRVESSTFSAQEISGMLDLAGNLTDNTGLYEIILEFDRPNSETIDIVLSNEENESISIGFDPIQNYYYVDRTFAGKSDFSEHFAGLHSTKMLDYASDRVRMHLFIDHSSVELFADDGRAVMTDLFFPNSYMTNLELRVTAGQINLLSGEVHRLNSVWGK